MEEMNIQNDVTMTSENTENQSTQSDQVIEPQNQSIYDDRERNFAVLREKAERAERERDEAVRYIQQMQMQSSNNNQNVSDDDNSLAPDDLVEVQYLNKKIKKFESQLQNYEHYINNNVADARIKSQFNDFDQVVTPENIDILRNNYPEIAQSLHATPDLYSKAVSTYNIIKKFGIAQTRNPQSEYEKTLVQKNSSKPRATNSISPQQGETPLNKANEFANGILTPERKAQLYKEMMEARNNF